MDNRSVSPKKYPLFLLLAAAVFLISGIFILIRTGVLSSNGKNNSDRDVFLDVLLDIPSAREHGSAYFEPDSTDPLAYITEFDSFTATYSVYDYYNSSSGSVYFVTKSKNKFRIENESNLIIYNGRELYTSTSVYSTKTKNDDFSFFSEIGSLSLSEIKQLISEKKASPELKNNGIFVDIIYPHDNDLTDEYVLSAENGLIISSKTYQGSLLRRESKLSNISIISENDIDSAVFVIPD